MTGYGGVAHGMPTPEAFLDWLIEMDTPGALAGVERRRRCTMTDIIDYAREVKAAEQKKDRGAPDEGFTARMQAIAAEQAAHPLRTVLGDDAIFSLLIYRRTDEVAEDLPGVVTRGAEVAVRQYREGIVAAPIMDVNGNQVGAWVAACEHDWTEWQMGQQSIEVRHCKKCGKREYD